MYSAPSSDSAGFHGEVTEFFNTGLAFVGRWAEGVLLVVISSLNCHFINRKSPNELFQFNFVKYSLTILEIQMIINGENLFTNNL